METLRKVIGFTSRIPRNDRGRTLWAIILIKLFILFAVLKVFFFPRPARGQSPRKRPAACWKT